MSIEEIHLKEDHKPILEDKPSSTPEGFHQQPVDYLEILKIADTREWALNVVTGSSPAQQASTVRAPPILQTRFKQDNCSF